MVDFKKLNEDLWNSLTTEEQHKRITYEKLLKDNRFYETTTLTEIEKDGMVIRKAKADIELIRRVNRHTLEVDSGLILSFGGYSEYAFDKRFINLITEQLQSNPERGFYIDIGYGRYVTNSEMLRIIKESLNSLTAHNIQAEEDSLPELTNSEMGKMLSAMGLR